MTFYTVETMKFKVWIKKYSKACGFFLTSLMCADYKRKIVLYWTLSATFKEPCGISGPWPLENWLVCSGEPVKYERKWRGAELEGIRCSSAILTDTVCPEEQETDKQAIRKDRAIRPAHIYNRHSTESKWKVSISHSSFPTSQGLILFWRETRSPALR